MTKFLTFDARKSIPQTIQDGFGGFRTYIFRGRCIGCGSRVYSNGDNDPRGVAGPSHTWFPVEPEQFTESNENSEYKNAADLPACWGCMNERPKWERVKLAALKAWNAAAKVTARQ